MKDAAVDNSVATGVDRAVPKQLDAGFSRFNNRLLWVYVGAFRFRDCHCRLC